MLFFLNAIFLKVYSVNCLRRRILDSELLCSLADAHVVNMDFLDETAPLFIVAQVVVLYHCRGFELIMLLRMSCLILN